MPIHITWQGCFLKHWLALWGKWRLPHLKARTTPRLTRMRCKQCLAPTYLRHDRGFLSLSIRNQGFSVPCSICYCRWIFYMIVQKMNLPCFSSLFKRLGLFHTNTHTHTHTLSLSLSLTHTHTHKHTIIQKINPAYFLSSFKRLGFFQPHTHTHTHTWTHTHNHPPNHQQNVNQYKLVYILSKHSNREQQ